MARGNPKNSRLISGFAYNRSLFLSVKLYDDDQNQEALIGDGGGIFGIPPQPKNQNTPS